MKRVRWRSFLSIICSFLLLPEYLYCLNPTEKLADSILSPVGHIRIIVDEPKVKIYINGELEGLAHLNRPMLRQYLPAGSITVKAAFSDNTELTKNVQVLHDQTVNVEFYKNHNNPLLLDDFQQNKTIIPSAPADNRPVELILQEADKLFELQRYTTPENQNAFMMYHSVLKTDPANNRAREQSAVIMTFYYSVGTASEKEFDFEKANDHYDRYLFVAKNLQKVAPELVNSSELSYVQKRKAAIESLLNTVNEQLKKGDIFFIAHRFTTPKDMNALSVYLDVLKLDPLNRRALQKIREMMRLYETWGNTAFDQQKYHNAKLFYHQYLLIAEDAAKFDKKFCDGAVKHIEKRLSLIKDIEYLLKQGDDFFQKGLFISEGEEDAFHTYKQVLVRHSINQHARNKIHLITKKLKSEGDKAYAQHRFEDAKTRYQDFIRTADYLFSITRNRKYEQEIKTIQSLLADIRADSRTD